MRRLTWKDEDKLAALRTTIPRPNWLRGRAYKFNYSTRCFESMDGDSISEEKFEIERCKESDERMGNAINRIAKAISSSQ